MLGETFTVLAVLKATDEMSKVLEQVDGSLGHFSETAAKTAEVATEAGAQVDEALLKTASGADALDLAAARAATAEEKLAAATARQAEAEQALLTAREAVAGQEEIAASADRLAAAERRAATAAEELKAAKANVAALKAAKAGEDELAAAAKRLADADTQATLATEKLTAAKARDAELTKPEDVLAAADALTAAEKKTASASRELSDAQARQAAMQQTTTVETEEAAVAAGGLSHGYGIAALGLAAAGGMAVKAAGDFQSSTQHLVTDAGESQKNLQMVQQGILNVATATGTSASQLSDAMYHIESAGFHGAAGLTLLKTAAEGAKVGGADFETVAKTLTGTMNAYNMSGDQATQMMNALISTVGAGDMRMQDLASSLGNVAPLAAAAGISFDQVGGAIATMTAQNMSAQQASQDLAGTIRALSNPNKVAIDEMQQMGIDSNDLAQNLGQRGLTGTLETVTAAIAQHTQGGQVFIDTLKESKTAAADAKLMIQQLPASIQKAAEGYLQGSVSTQQFNKDIKSLTPEQQHLAQQFEKTAKNTDSFNKLLTSGSPAAQTMNAALSKVLGGATGLNTALMLTGGRMQTFEDNTKTVADALHKGGSQVDNWDKIQGTFNQKLETAKAAVEAAGISLGTVLLPVVSKVAEAITAVVVPMSEWINKNRTMVGLIATVVGVLATGIGIIKGIELATKAWAAAQAILNVALDANPIGLIIIAIAALVAGIIYAWTHFKGFRDVVIGVFEGTKQAALAFWHSLEAIWHGIATGVTWLWHHIESAWNGVVGAAMTVWHTLEAVWNTVQSVTETVWKAISGFFEKWWPLLLAIFAAPIAILIGLWNHTHQALFDGVKTIWSAISAFFVTVWHGISSTAQTTWNLIKAYIVRPLEDAWADIVAGWNVFAGWISAAWNTFTTGVAYIWNLVYEYIVRPFEQAYNYVAGVADQLGSTISSAFNGILNWLGGVGDWFADVGSNIVRGMVNGIYSGWNWLMGAVKDVANSALHYAKELLGISSPSRAFADQVGKWIPHGIAQGVTENASVAHDAVGSLAASLPLAAGIGRTGVGATSFAATAGLGLAAVATPAATAGPSVYIDLRGSQVLGNQAMDQLASKVGQTVTQQLAAAGVRIRG